MSSPDTTDLDVMAHADARALLDRLQRAGIRLQLSRGNICSLQSDRIAPEDVMSIRQWKPIIMVLLLAFDERTLDRLVSLKAGRLGGPDAEATERPSCYACGENLPRRRPMGRCGWCAIAARLHAGCGVPLDVLALFDPAIVGDRPARARKPLPFDVGAPAA
jgi:hypothetical protein